MMGLMSATIPTYAAECVSANFKGTPVRTWLIFTSFGMIMCGYMADGIIQQTLGLEVHPFVFHNQEKGFYPHLDTSRSPNLDVKKDRLMSWRGVSTAKF